MIKKINTEQKLQEPIPWVTGRVLLVSAVLIALLSIAIFRVPGFVAKRIYGAVLPGGAAYDFAQTLLRNMAICALASVTMLLILWSRRRQISYTNWGRWCLWSSVGLFVAASLCFWWYVDDDAGISFTYARHLACGQGLVFNPGDTPVEGYSNPLWVLLLSGAKRCGADIVVTAKTMGIIFGSLCLILMYCVLKDASPFSLVALPLAAGNAAMIVWFNSGLENSLHGLLLIACVALLAKTGHEQRLSMGLITLLCLLVLSRPEGFVFTLAITLLLLIRTRQHNGSLRSIALTLMIPAMMLGALILFRLLYFGDILPNTFYAKATSTNPLRLLNPFSGGWGYVGQAMQGTGWTIAIVPLMMLLASRKLISPAISAALAIVLGQLFFVVSVGGDWMAEFRFVASIVPVVTILMALALANLRHLLDTAFGSRHWHTALCMAIALLMAIPQFQRLVVFAHSPTTPMATVTHIGEYFKELADRAGISEPTLLAHDAGGTSYAAQIHLIDLAGLCDRTLAKHAHDRDVLRRYLFEEKRPTFIFSAKVFADRIGLEDFPEFQSDYVPLPPAPNPELDSDIRRVRQDLYPKIANGTKNDAQP